MMAANLHDDNLRLIFSTQERKYLAEEVSYHRTSLIYCGLIYIATFMFAMIYPLILVISPQSSTVLFIFGGLLGLVSFCATLMVFPIWVQLRKHKKLMHDHKEFMRKYNRLE